MIETLLLIVAAVVLAPFLPLLLLGAAFLVVIVGALGLVGYGIAVPEFGFRLLSVAICFIGFLTIGAAWNAATARLLPRLPAWLRREVWK